MAAYMFDDEDADFILRSSRPQTDFRVHRAIISIASPPLGAMLALPQPPCENPSPPTPALIPVVEVSESATTLRLLLQLIYPVAETPTPETFTTIDDLVSVFEAAYKYDVDGAIARLKMILVSPKWLESSPLRVYAIAMRWDMEEEAKIASKHTLREDLFGSPILKDFRHTSGLAFQRLALLHRSRSKAAQALVETATMPFNPCSSCRTNANPLQWFAEWKVEAKKELSLRPTTQVIFSLQFLGPIWAVPLNPTHICPSNICERNRTWSTASGTSFDALKAKIDALPSTI